MNRSKYKVSAKKEKRTYNGITFASELEMKYYRDIIIPDIKSGAIREVKVQPKYKLQDGFDKYGRKFQPVYYVSDFEVQYSDGDIRVIDVKGLPTEAATLKRKWFDKRYHDKILVWIAYAKKYGGWIEYDELVRKRTADKRKAG